MSAREASARRVVVEVVATELAFEGEPATLITASNGTHGSVRVKPDGSVDYRPRANFLGLDSFTYTVADRAGRMGQGRVTVLVRAADGEPSPERSAREQGCDDPNARADARLPTLELTTDDMVSPLADTRDDDKQFDA